MVEPTPYGTTEPFQFTFLAAKFAGCRGWLKGRTAHGKWIISWYIGHRPYDDGRMYPSRHA
eukprot:1139684-Pelagomonas_calceolata.AAC.2